MKERIAQLLQDSLKKKFSIELPKEKITSMIETPPSLEMGDYAFPCFAFSKQLDKMNPVEIAMKLRAGIGTESPMEFDDIVTNGPYINFFIDRKALARKVVWESINQRANYGKSKLGKKLFGRKKVIVEFSSPNIAKPIGIGHLRSTIIGNSIANIAEFVGYKAIRINYLGDWGTPHGKIIHGFQKFGSQDKLEKDPIQHLYEIYVKLSKDEKYEEPARETFKKMEQGDKETLMLWKIFRNLSLKEFKKIYEKLGIKFDVYSGESETVSKTKDIIKELTNKKLLIESKGAYIVDLNQYNLGACLIQKTDGSTLYATRDLITAIQRKKKYTFDKMIYEVGQEQKLHFQQVFKTLELMGYNWAKDCIHAEHGLYLDNDGKKFATRKGKTFFLEDVFKETEKLAKKEVLSRFHDLEKEELESRVKKIAIAAVFYGDLKNNRTNNMIFDLNKFVSFDGNTGPYILYSYARASSILEKAKKNIPKWEIKDLEEKEYELIKKISQFQKVVQSAWNDLNPSLIANYSYELAQLFNEFYQQCPVINSENETFRLALVESFRQVIKNSFSLLGIETIEKM